MENKYAQRIETLRTLMAAKGWDAVILTGSDPHSSEYPAERWKQVEWLTGFTGEAGDVVVTADHAGLWTDTRYFIQANRQLEGTGAVLHKTRVSDQVLIPEWLAAWQFFENDRSPVIAVDGLCQSVGAIDEIKAAFAEGGKEEPQIVSVPDLLSALWEDRPAIPHTPVITIGEDICGESRQSKIARLREFVEQQGAGAILLTTLDEIAWTLNVRGSDIAYNPFVISNLEVSADAVKWFVRKDDYNAEAPDTLDSFDELAEEGIEILPYDETSLTLSQDMSPEAPLLVDPSTLNWAVWNSLDQGSLRCCPSPVGLWKAVKNEVEVQGMRECHIQDGVAMEKFLFWLESSVKAGEGVDEWEAAEKLRALRAGIDGYKGESFETISAYGQGAALPHYITPSSDAPLLSPQGLYLCDSGAQYLSGTTDITRTVPLGACSYLEKEDYTLVLKGHIDLAMAVFPAGTAGCQIDALAREPLWKARRNFGHGTGHGVGFFLGVHEGPQDIRQNFNRQSLLPGMITSDEPGIYREGMHGVRHENLLLCVEDSVNEFGRWLRFEPLTLCHFDTAALLPEMLDSAEKQWLNNYNETVFRTLSPYLDADQALWLKEKCRAI